MYSSTGWGEVEKAREKAAPSYLKGRVERGEALPVVEVVVSRGMVGGGGGRLPYPIALNDLF